MAARLLARMKRAWLLRGVLAAALVGVFLLALLWPGGINAATAGPGTEDRRMLFVSMITLGVLGLALYGFDLREWL